ncbi:MAG: hypothetical protein Q8L47_00825 [bacterium]|nr:hypothetical protein [bacterium]
MKGIRKPVVILRNMRTGRFHPFVFVRYPVFAGFDRNTATQRFKSEELHNKGFFSVIDAKYWITANKELDDTGYIWEWDGNRVPRLIKWFPNEQIIPSYTGRGKHLY